MQSESPEIRREATRRLPRCEYCSGARPNSSEAALANLVWTQVCSMPYEYCQDSPSFKRCKAALQAENVPLYNKLHGSSNDNDDETTDKGAQLTETPPSDTLLTDLVQKTADLALKDAEAAATKVKELKDDTAKHERLQRQRAASKVTIKLAQRKSKKQVTIINGLEVFDVELKRAAKFFAQKFACGSTVSKDASGKDEIVIQGEFADKIVVIIGKEYPQVPRENIQVSYGKEKPEKQ